MALALALTAQAQTQSQTAADDTVVQAREAFRKKDKAALANARAALSGTRHPLAMWVDYWELSNRLPEVQQPELDAFYVRWPNTYVEDRLRNDWLLELGKRRDWANLKTEFPRFRMNDDREVTCYALLAQQQGGQDVSAAARSAWTQVRDGEDGCAHLGRALVDARLIGVDDIWPVARTALEFNRPRVARFAATLVSTAAGQAVVELLDSPVRYLARRHALPPAVAHELALLALIRAAGNDPDYTAGQLADLWQQHLPRPLLATAWAHTAKQASLRLLPSAADHARRAWQLWDAAAKPGTTSATQPDWGDDLLAWHVRAALRQTDSARWLLIQRATEAMSPAEQRDAAWTYWRARAVTARAAAGADGEPARAAARQALEGIAPQLGFYGQLAGEELGNRLVLPAAPLPLSAAERETPRRHGGLARAQALINIGLRPEGVREWNYSLRGMSEREMLAAAQMACEREVYDRCISTSERTKSEIDVALRYPMPLREQVVAKARGAGLDPAVVYGLIRQESRFVMDARSSVGASGLMQLMPATARWTAKQIGLDYRGDMITDREVNLQLGAAYLKRVLDDFGGSLAMAAAAYNAGPGRPRKWREGTATLEPAAWAETIPFTETRDYVKKVLSNSTVYAALLGPSGATLKARLGPPIGPRGATAAVPDRDIP